MAFYRASHEKLLRAVGHLSDADLVRAYSIFQPGEPGTDSGAPIIGWIMSNTAGHYEEHIASIKQLIGEGTDS